MWANKCKQTINWEFYSQKSMSDVMGENYFRRNGTSVLLEVMEINYIMTSLSVVTEKYWPEVKTQRLRKLECNE